MMNPEIIVSKEKFRILKREELLTMIEELPPGVEIAILGAGAFPREIVIEKAAMGAFHGDFSHKTFANPSNAYILRPKRDVI